MKDRHSILMGDQWPYNRLSLAGVETVRWKLQTNYDTLLVLKPDLQFT